MEGKQLSGEELARKFDELSRKKRRLGKKLRKIKAEMKQIEPDLAQWLEDHNFSTYGVGEGREVVLREKYSFEVDCPEDELKRMLVEEDRLDCLMFVYARLTSLLQKDASELDPGEALPPKVEDALKLTSEPKVTTRYVRD